VEEALVKEYRKRIEMKLSGKELLDKSLVFYRILSILNNGSKTRKELLSELGHSEECIENNLLYLEKSGFVKQLADKFSLSSRGSKLTAREM